MIRLVLSLLLVLTFPLSLPGQVRIPTGALATSSQLEQIVQRGRELEEQGAWGDALGHYEKALRQFPDSPVLQERLLAARAHYDVARRYSDQSFLRHLHSLSASQVLDGLDEVLQKVDAYYVAQPDWQAMAAQAARQIRALLDLPEASQHVTDPQRLDDATAWLLELDRMRWKTPPASRDDLSALARYAAREAPAKAGIAAPAVAFEFAAAVSVLDPYSSLLTAGQLEEVFSQIEGDFVGLGIELKADGETLLIVNVIPGGPAADAGIHSGDRIVQVDGRPVADLTTDRAADLLKGPEGSSVTLTLRSPDGQVRQVSLQRRHVEVPSVTEARILDRGAGIAYMKLANFQKTTLRHVDQALWQLHRQGMKSLIIDLRGNPGGLLTAAVEVADRFIDQGTIVSTRGRNWREDFDYRAHGFGTWRVPLVVLIDEDSASASEIFAAAIQDHRRGTIVGRPSYGKGSVQGIFPLTRMPGGIRLTTARFFAPSGQPISGRGVLPEVAVHSTLRPGPDGRAIQTGEDADLEAALRVARQLIARAR